MLIGDPFAAQRAAHPLAADGRDQPFLEAVGAQLAHRLLGERQPQVLRPAEGYPDERPYLLAVDDEGPACAARTLAEGREPRGVEAVQPVLRLAPTARAASAAFIPSCRHLMSRYRSKIRVGCPLSASFSPRTSSSSADIGRNRNRGAPIAAPRPAH